MSIINLIMSSAGVELGVRAKNKLTRYPGDEFWLQVTLLVNGDDLNDHSLLHNECTTTGTTNYVTSNEKYGVGSLYFPGSGNSFIVKSNTSTLLGLNNDFTVEFWHFSSPAYNKAGIIGSWNTNSFAGSQSWIIAFDSNGKIYASVKSSDETTTVSTTPGTISANIWHHIAFVRYGNTFTLYIDGVSVGSFFYAGTLATGPNRLVMNGYDNGNAYFSGFLDDIRITNGLARYTSNFSIPTETFQTSMRTAAMSPFLLGDELFGFVDGEAFVGMVSMGSQINTIKV